MSFDHDGFTKERRSQERHRQEEIIQLARNEPIVQRAYSHFRAGGITWEEMLYCSLRDFVQYAAELERQLGSPPKWEAQLLEGMATLKAKRDREAEAYLKDEETA